MWMRGDPLPELPPVAGFSAAPVHDPVLVARVMSTNVDAIEERFRDGHRPWLARIGDEPAAWGWVATRHAAIPELGIDVRFPAGDRYLWDFGTLPAWRGRGIYPALLQAIIKGEGAERFWIGHDWDNVASARGIERAGFQRVGTVYRTDQGVLVLVPCGPAERVTAASSLFGIPVIAD